MSSLAGSPDVCASTSVLPHTFRREAGLDKKPRQEGSSRSGKFCLRCGGLLISSYTASLERDGTGGLLTLWRCVNCGDCVDSDILANRWKNHEPSRQRARPPIGPQYTGWSRGATGMNR